jgi:hypothetical protein
MDFDDPRMAREYKTVRAMTRLYCRDHHGRGEDLCGHCRKLLRYSGECLEKCPFQEGKTTCVNCPVHCFKPEMRERVRMVMRYAGPRMFRRHPVMAIFHFIDGRRKEPVDNIRKKAAPSEKEAADGGGRNGEHSRLVRDTGKGDGPRQEVLQ